MRPRLPLPLLASEEWHRFVTVLCLLGCGGILCDDLRLLPCQGITLPIDLAPLALIVGTIGYLLRELRGRHPRKPASV